MDVEVAKNLLLDYVCSNCRYHQWYFQMTQAVCTIDASYASYEKNGTNKLQEGTRSLHLNNTCERFEDGRMYGS